ncbi:uncharacterized protein GGS25DRAFT_485833 [Hypoxylon fragiforme]|uniref:uncharacterized protein n=1 Tax=Hypoxylon fragiforme TaxID=63214 RepID=UPI0020C6D1B0|nr:uncharacterized protein GGS25DRAFT_485833 [Hypoxylon fragiforme]KAI2609695.1 hypothetical protein GGS25DRAFT_485833 [Hypoxylon fragiforme]
MLALPRFRLSFLSCPLSFSHYPPYGAFVRNPNFFSGGLFFNIEGHPRANTGTTYLPNLSIPLLITYAIGAASSGIT